MCVYTVYHAASLQTFIYALEDQCVGTKARLFSRAKNTQVCLVDVAESGHQLLEVAHGHMQRTGGEDTGIWRLICCHELAPSWEEQKALLALGQTLPARFILDTQGNRFRKFNF